MQMQALKAHRYGTERKAGDLFEVRSCDVRLMKALGWQIEAPQESTEAEPKPKRTYTRKIVNVEPEVISKPVKRQYFRRDLTAEE
jgi:hypothetical protein